MQRLTSLSTFFFSSRRRHTRCLSDWSSDVCSSDLPTLQLKIAVPQQNYVGILVDDSRSMQIEIGRASCRERVWDAEGEGVLGVGGGIQHIVWYGWQLIHVVVCMIGYTTYNDTMHNC